MRKITDSYEQVKTLISAFSELKYHNAQTEVLIAWDKAIHGKSKEEPYKFNVGDMVIFDSNIGKVVGRYLKLHQFQERAYLVEFENFSEKYVTESALTLKINSQVT